MRDEGDDVVKVEEKAVAVVAPKKTVEEWATARGMLPAVFGGGALGLPAGASGRSVKVSLSESSRVAPRSNPKFVEFAAARALHAWPEGAELTEAEFDEAVAKAYGPKSQITCR